jgi:excinuclease ABC subunit B
VVVPEQRQKAIHAIQAELRERLATLRSENKLLEAQRLEQRTQFDVEMLITMGHCNGIENYSRHMTGREPGLPPPCLLNYFPDDWLLVIDESHQSVPQVGAMYRGDRSRKSTLVDYGFRLPSALDNRPLTFGEFEDHMRQVIFVSATPADYELDRCEGVVTEQILRPTGLLDPEIEVRPAADQVDDVYGEIRLRIEAGERVLITTLTKRMSEDLTEYLKELGIRVQYLHSDVDTLERMNILRDLRKGVFDVLVGINLLREGLDLPEVSLVAILDADKEGFLRSARALIQTAGRASRNAHGKVIMYADKVTVSMQECIDATARRRALQAAYNAEHGITPTTIVRSIRNLDGGVDEVETRQDGTRAQAALLARDPATVSREIVALRDKMSAAAKNLEFEKAAEYRDAIRSLEALLLTGQPTLA